MRKAISNWYIDNGHYWYVENKSLYPYDVTVPMSQRFYEQMIKFDELYNAIQGHLKRKFRKYKAKGRARVNSS